jgi:hypothetical protein
VCVCGGSRARGDGDAGMGVKERALFRSNQWVVRQDEMR